MNMRALRLQAIRLWKEWIRPLLPVAAIIIPLRTSIADYSPVPTGSMKPTILEGDLVFVNKVAYDLKIPMTTKRIAAWADPERGDIVVCLSPGDGTRLVKRVIGLPGDVVAMQDNRLWINGNPVKYSAAREEWYQDMPDLQKQTALFAAENLDGRLHAVMSMPQIRMVRCFGPVRIPEGQYFMMGDNRDNSHDSRYFGMVDRRVIIGRVQGIIGSLNIRDQFQPRWRRFFTALD